MASAVAAVAKKRQADSLIGTADEVLAPPALWLSTGSLALDRICRGFNPGGVPLGRIIHVAGAWSTGKAVSVTTPLVTPAGFVKASSIRVGDLLMGSDGRPTRVEGVYPQGKRKLFCVQFDDGTSLDVDAEHLWVVKREGDATSKPLRLMTTSELQAAGLTYGKKRNPKWYIPFSQPVHYAKQEPLPIDPYVLGVLIGDGNMRAPTGVSWAKPSESIAAEVQRRLPPGFRVTVSGDRVCYYITQQPYRKVNALRVALGRLNLEGKYSYQRFVPPEYHLASPADRLSLLQGLFDTDGRAAGVAVEFGTTSKRLAADVASLVRSLGGWASVTGPQPSSYVKDGTRIACRDSYRVWVRMREGLPPFRAAREKQARLKAPVRRRSRRIVSITPIARRQRAVCFRVAASDNLFLAKDFIVTHNSVWLDQLAVSFQRADGVTYISETEGSRDTYFADRIGLDLSRVVIDRPLTMEEAFENFLSFHAAFRKKDQKSPMLYGVDSLDSTKTERSMGDMTESKGWMFGGARSQVLGVALGKLAGVCARYPTTVVLLNQVREKIGVMFGPKQFTPGGNPPHFYASLEIWLSGAPRPGHGYVYSKYEGHAFSAEERKRLGLFKDLAGRVEGRWIRARVTKSKVSSTFDASCDFYLDFHRGIRSGAGFPELLLIEGVVEKTDKAVIQKRWLTVDKTESEEVARFKTMQEWAVWLKDPKHMELALGVPSK